MIVKAGSAWRKANHDKTRAYYHKRQAKLRSVGGSFTAKEWLGVLAKFNDRCAHCGKPEKLTVDHIVPRSKGGNDKTYNLQVLCGSCNSHKGTR